MTKERELILVAKYRDPDKPGCWYLTDFTMEQMEGRLEQLINENADLRDEVARLQAIVDFRDKQISALIHELLRKISID